MSQGEGRREAVDSVAPPQPAGQGNVVKTVLFAFLGIRKRAAHEEQTVRLTPVQIIVTGIIAAAVFVVSLVLLAKFIVGKAMG